MLYKRNLLGWFIFVTLLIATGYFLFTQVQKSTFFQEYNKLILGIVAIFLAFSPVFYVFTYSNNEIKEIIVKISIKKDYDFYFKKSLIFSFLILITSLFAVIISYLEINEIYTKAYTILTSISISSTITALYWIYLFGKLSIQMISELIN